MWRGLKMGLISRFISEWIKNKSEKKIKKNNKKITKLNEQIVKLETENKEYNAILKTLK